MTAKRLIQLDYTPRRQFLPFHERSQRWACLLAHRRSGKTVATINDIVRRAIVENKQDGQYGYLGPYRGQVKKIAWSYLKKFAQPILGADPNESELWVKLLNGAVIQLFGADNPDSLRGAYFDGVVIDEYADIRPSLWTGVVRPMLVDRKGWAVFIGTPKGKNQFWELWRDALKDTAWYTLRLPASESKIISQDELDDALKDMGTDMYMQEFELSFDAAIRGAFYGEQLGEMLKAGRIRELPVDRAAVVHTAWDLGRTDSTAIWFIQCVGTERRLIDYYETSGVTLDHYAGVLLDKRRSVRNPNGYVYGNHYLPHDIQVKELMSELSRKETLEQLLGADITVVQQHNVLDGINAVRRGLDRTWIDPVRCERGLEAMRNYVREWDERLKDWKQSASHNWASHGADAIRQFFVGHDEPDLPRQEDRHRRHREAPQSAWAV